MAIKKPTPPGSVARVAAMQDGEVRRIDAVFDKVEPVVIIVTSRFDVALAAAGYKRRIIGKGGGSSRSPPR